VGVQRGQRLGEALEVLDAQLWADVEVLGKAGRAVLECPPAAGEHVSDVVLVERVVCLQRLEHAADTFTL